ncbi:MAG TPA: lysylphosphatidylglycerol synthase domain-containing protein [Noviherbaspirillum sp.]|uniref:lysylphosphatidylglycerol synthase domain-containing protein n=1 Tax=Noviherbaspirillum sp. TaxID=1926288 RepID=UPI002B47110D|nr:lysylphosphatidylglycerol synthase domain-containing protein [Noviherbaspirillum sp.]HJV86224.1 lysylphosphatidylglycerol synthase domain-containing protein [Noviherbaspirillum sp.]
MSGQKKAVWRGLGRLLTLAFFVVVVLLLAKQVRSVEWGQVLDTMRQRPVTDLLAAALLAAASFALYSCFDLLGRRLTGHALPVRRVMTINFISYVFNLNIGAMVGGVAFRYRLYSRFGLGADAITQVVAMSMLTNWIGYVLLTGLVFLRPPVALPDGWRIGTIGLQALAGVLLAAALAYLLLCAFSRRRWSFRGRELWLPSGRMALLQFGMSSLNWMLMAATLFVLLEQKIAYAMVLGSLLVAAIAGVITHIPAGLGVLEAVFVALLPGWYPRSELLAALLTYRVIYYLLPLTLAGLIYLNIELRANKDGRRMARET